MSRIKSMSRGGWIVIGIVVALLLVPTSVAVAAGLKYTGIEGTTLNKANVTAANQLLTTEALPTTYEDYSVTIADAGTGSCSAVTSPIPAGDALVVQQVEMDIYEADSPTPHTSPTPGNLSNSSVGLVADNTGSPCGSGAVMTLAEAPGGNVGNVAIPLVPGYVIPNGYRIDASAFGIDVELFVTGYLVPSADAPASPQIAHGTTQLRRPPAS